MPAVLKRTEGSFSGTNEAEGIILCSLFSKKVKYFFLSSLEFIFIIDYHPHLNLHLTSLSQLELSLKALLFALKTIRQ